MSGRNTIDTAPEPAVLFAALGDRTRLSLIATLSDGQTRSIAQLAEGFSLTRQGVTKHLRVLQQAGVVASTQVGREQRFVFKPQPITEARDYLERVGAQWDAAIRRLARLVDADAVSRDETT